MKFDRLIKGIAVSAMAVAAATVAQATEVLTFAHVYEVNHPLHIGAEQVAKEVAEKTDGRVEIKVFPASSLGKELELSEGLSLGTVDIIYTGIGFVSAFYAPIGMPDYPFTLRGMDHWRAFRDSDLFKDMSAELSANMNGNVVAGLSYYGSRHVTSNKPVLVPADMEGLKIRVPNAPAYLMFPEAVGANPTPMAFAEVYLGLQQGVVDAQENPLTTIQAKKFYEVQSNINLTGHIMNSTLTLVSKSKLDKLSEEDRAIVMEALANNADFVTDTIESAEGELVEWFRAQGITVNEVDRAPFMAAVAPALTADGLPFTAEQFEALQALPGNE
jgi:tripartite ATP-independent transporter DctP family solute receptor